MSKTSIAGTASVVILCIFGFLMFMGGFKVVPEGHVGVVKRFKEAHRSIQPGFNLKIPFVDEVELFQTRELKDTEELSAATKDQLAIGAVVSFNWRIQPTEALTILKEYGSPETFLNRIVEPRVREAAKETLGKFTYEDMIQRREQVSGALRDSLERKIAGFPVIVRQGIIEDVSAPETYKQAVREKQIAQQEAEREKHKLARQKLEAQQRVNTAEAEAEAISIVARANAERIRLEGEALAANPEVLARLRIEAWKDGGSQVPDVLSIGGEGQDFIYSLSPKQ